MKNYCNIICLILALSILSMPVDAFAARKKRPFQWPPEPKKETTTTDDKKAETPQEAPKVEKKTEPAPAENKPAKDPYTKEVWTADDVKKLCENNFRGDHGITSCISRNERRIGRTKTPYHQNRLQ